MIELVNYENTWTPLDALLFTHNHRQHSELKYPCSMRGHRVQGVQKAGIHYLSAV